MTFNRMYQLKLKTVINKSNLVFFILYIFLSPTSKKQIKPFVFNKALQTFNFDI